MPHSASSSFEPLARTPDGVVLTRLTIGRVEHLLTGFSLVQSTWPVHASFPLFMAGAIDSLPSQRESVFGSVARTDEPVNLSVPRDAATLELVNPAGVRVRSFSSTEVREGRIGLGVLDQVGLWHLGTRPIAVDLVNQTESSLISPRVLPIASATAPNASTQPGEQAGSGTSRLQGMPVEIWPWILIGACVLLGAEWIVYGLRVRV